MRTGYLYRIIAIILLLLFSLQVLLSIPYKSPIFDEPLNLARGYVYVATGSKAAIAHPALMFTISSFPLLFLNLNLSDSYNHYLMVGDYLTMGQEIFYTANNNADMVFYVSRLPLLLLGVVLGIYVYIWAKKLYGRKAGLFALFLYSFNPLILGNTPLIMTDLIFTAFGFISVYYLWKFLSGGKLLDLLLTGIAIGLAQVSKFTALFLVPLYLLLIFFSAYDFSFRIFFRELIYKNRIKKLVSLAFPILIMLVLIIFVINIAYGFDGIFKSTEARIKGDSTLQFDKEYFMPDAVAGRLTSNPAIRSGVSIVLNYLPSILPYGYIKDVVSVVRANTPSLEGSVSGSFLMGEYSDKGWWYFYLFALLIKTPIPLLIFILLSLVSFFILKFRSNYEIFLIGPILMFFIYFSSFYRVQTSRYVLSLFPFLFVFTSRILSDRVKISRLFILSIILLSSWYVAESISAFPNYTTYFNQIIGGPSNGYKYLQGTDLDAGQDLPLLAKYVRNNKITNLKLAYYGTPDPFYYLDFTCLACPVCHPDIISKCPEKCEPTEGMVAVSASLLQNIPQEKNRNCFDWLKSYEPIEKVGYTIFVYNISDIASS